MSNATIFRKVEAREISASEGAQLLLAEDAAKRVRPAWAPKWARVLGGFVFLVLLSLIGLRRDST